MFREEADGSAVVWGVPVAPFVPMQHLQVDMSVITRLGNYCFRSARERGWLQTAAELARATPYAEDNAARPLVGHEGHAYPGSDNTFFTAGVEEALANPHPHFHFPPVPSSLLAAAHFHLVHVGSSSYGVFGQLYTYFDGEPESARRLLGTFKVTTVWVSKTTRAPTPLLADKRALFSDILARDAAGLRASEGARVERLPVKAMVERSGWFECAAAAAAADVTAYDHGGAPPPADYLVTVPAAAAPLWLLHRRHFELREADIDFNLHLNQLVTKVLVIDAFRNAVADPRCAYSCLLRPGVPTNRADLLLRRFRIDYVREVPMHYAATEVFLFPMDAAGARARFAAGASETDMLAIGFFTVGVPRAAGDRFVATVGVMTAATCFLH